MAVSSPSWETAKQTGFACVRVPPCFCELAGFACGCVCVCLCPCLTSYLSRNVTSNNSKPATTKHPSSRLVGLFSQLGRLGAREHLLREGLVLQGPQQRQGPHGAAEGPLQRLRHLTSEISDVPGRLPNSARYQGLKRLTNPRQLRDHGGFHVGSETIHMQKTSVGMSGNGSMAVSLLVRKVIRPFHWWFGSVVWIGGLDWWFGGVPRTIYDPGSNNPG